MTLTKSQQQQLEMLSDGKWHNINNNGVKGLRYNSLDVLVERGLVETKRKKDDEPSLAPDPTTIFNPYYDNFFKVA
jgi:hypothetical protein